MGLFDTMLGDAGNGGMSLRDQDVITDMLKDSRFALQSLAQSVTEIQHPMLRAKLKQQLLTAISDHYNIADLAVRKEWYQPYLPAEAQLGRDVQHSQQWVHTQ